MTLILLDYTKLFYSYFAEMKVKLNLRKKHKNHVFTWNMLTLKFVKKKKNVCDSMLKLMR